MDPVKARDLFPVTKTRIFLNHAACSPLSRPVMEAMGGFLADRMLAASANFSDWMAALEKTRESAALLVNAEPDDIAFVPNTSTGLSLVARGLELGQGDAVAVGVPDFPSNVLPWLDLERDGVKVDRVKRDKGALPPEAVAARLGSDTRLAALSTADWATGWTMDVNAVGTICADNGTALCLDGIQSVGARPLDVAACKADFLAVGGHKWLMGPLGMGFLHVSKRMREQMRPCLLGWHSRNNPETFALDMDLSDTARRFEPGTFNHAGVAGLGAALDLLLAVGMDTVFERIMELTDRVMRLADARGFEVLTPREESLRCGIVCFKVPHDPDQVWQALNQRGAMVSSRGGAIRVSPHFYNTAGEIDMFFKELDGVLQSPGRASR